MGNIDRNYTLLRGRIAQLADLSNVSPTLASKGPSSKPIRSLLNPDHSDVGNKEEEEEEEEEEYRSQREGKSPSQLLMVKQSSITLPAISVQPYASMLSTQHQGPFLSQILWSHIHIRIRMGSMSARSIEWYLYNKSFHLALLTSMTKAIGDSMQPSMLLSEVIVIKARSRARRTRRNIHKR